MRINTSNIFYPMIVFCFALFLFQHSCLYSQTEASQDSIQTTTYQFVNMWKLQQQAQKHGFQTTSLYKGYTLSGNGKKYRSLFPPKQTSPTTFQFTTSKGTDSLVVNSMPLASFDFIELQGNQTYQFGQATKYCIFSLIPAVVTTVARGGIHEEVDFMGAAFLGFIYMVPPFIINGIASSHAPSRFRVRGLDYFTHRNWHWDIGAFYGPLKLTSFNELDHKNTHSKGFYFNLQKSFSPFSYSFRLCHVPLPPIGNSLKEGDHELLVNPSLKTNFIHTNRFKMNILAGFVSPIFYLAKDSSYPYEYDYLWGSIEGEIQYYMTSNLAINFSSACHYTLDGHTRYPFYVGITYSRWKPSPPHLKHDQNKVLYQ